MLTTAAVPSKGCELNSVAEFPHTFRGVGDAAGAGAYRPLA